MSYAFKAGEQTAKSRPFSISLGQKVIEVGSQIKLDGIMHEVKRIRKIEATGGKIIVYGKAAPIA